MSWRDRAACRGMPTGLWFPEPGHRVGSARAKALCAGCPVRSDCLDAALEQVEATHGVWAGTSQRDRRRIARSRAQTHRTLTQEHTA